MFSKTWLRGGSANLPPERAVETARAEVTESDAATMKKRAAVTTRPIAERGILQQSSEPGAVG